jgi:hypothetical protein
MQTSSGIAGEVTDATGVAGHDPAHAAAAHTMAHIERVGTRRLSFNTMLFKAL